MLRRQFLGAAASGLAASVVTGCRSSMLAPAAASAPRPMDAVAFHAARRFVDTSSGRIAYIERGSGKAALFLHGFPLNGFQWRGAIDRLSGERRCIAPDFLGLGYTQVSRQQDLAPRAQVSMLVEVLDALAIDTVDVIANDSGGAVAQLLVTQDAPRVRTLLLTNCDTEIDSPPKAMVPVIELARAGLYADQWLVPWLADKTLARSSKGIGGICYADPAHPTDEAIDCYLAPLVRSSERKALTNRYALALERNPLEGIEKALERCEVPTRIVWGAADPIFSRIGADYLDRVLRSSRGVRYLDEAKLFFPEERSDVIAEEARRLWGVSSSS
jgi:pimeloyl-ACP methyl ester carboxylesterase